MSQPGLPGFWKPARAIHGRDTEKEKITMKQYLFSGLIASVLAGGIALSANRAKTEETPADYTRKVNRPYEKVLTALQEAAQAQGFRVTAVHDLAASMRKEGIERDPYSVVEVCKAEIASKVLQAEPRFGAFMPCRIAVYQQGSDTVVTTVLPTRLLAFFPVKAEVKTAAAKVDSILKTMIDTATR